MSEYVKYYIAWWDETPWPAAEPHWVKLPRAYESDVKALEDLEVWHKSYPFLGFSVLKIETQVVAQVKGEKVQEQKSEFVA